MLKKRPIKTVAIVVCLWARVRAVNGNIDISTFRAQVVKK
jgi:hypothetical protein